jgi:hypothetical protein
MNPYYYLFYKLSRSLNKKGNNEWGPIYALSVLIGWNILVVYINLFHITEANSKGIFKTMFGVIAIALFITNAILFLNKRRGKEITNRFKGETERNRKIGNLLVILYVILSLALIVFI